MKKAAIFLLAGILAADMAAQNPYYDILKLQGANAINDLEQIQITESNYRTVVPILAGYMGEDTATVDDIVMYYNADDDYLGNPFIDIAGGAQAQTFSETPVGSSRVQPLSAVGRLNITTFSQGLSLFMISRAKEELNIAFFQRFKKYFDKHEEIRALFPNTTDRIENMLEFQYTEMLPVLQKAFLKDMENLPDNMIQALLDTDLFIDIKEYPELLVFLNSYNLMRELQFMTPLQIIESLPDLAKRDTTVVAENLYNYLRVVSIISNAVTNSAIDDHDSRNWISFREFQDNILCCPGNKKVFTGLLYQQFKLEKIAINKQQLTTLIDSLYVRNSPELEWYAVQISKFMELSEKIKVEVEEIRSLQHQNAGLKKEDIYSYTNTLIDLIDFSTGFVSHYYGNGLKQDTCIKIAREMNNLYLNIVMGDYTIAMNSMLQLLEIANNNYRKKYDKDLFNEKLLSRISTCGLFIANVADAETPEQVQTAIETVALPAGSSSYKKYHKGNLAINAYLGANYNFRGVNTAVKSWDRSFNLTAPLGLNLSIFPIGKGGSVSLFAPIIDIGAIVDYELKEDSTFNQKIYLSNVFSPGCYIVYNWFSNMPLAIGIGGQYGPGLVKIDEALIDPKWRLNIFLVVDIPVINITRGSRIR